MKNLLRCFLDDLRTDFFLDPCCYYKSSVCQQGQKSLIVRFQVNPNNLFYGERQIGQFLHHNQFVYISVGGHVYSQVMETVLPTQHHVSQKKEKSNWILDLSKLMLKKNAVQVSLSWTKCVIYANSPFQMFPLDCIGFIQDIHFHLDTITYYSVQWTILYSIMYGITVG